MKKSLKYILLLFFWGCGPSWGVVQTETPVTLFSEQAIGINWRVKSFPVEPERQYSLDYSINFKTRNLIITVARGTLAPDLPRSQQKTLAEEQIIKIENLLHQVEFKDCKPVSEQNNDILVDYVEFFSGQNTTEPKTTIYKNDCRNISAITAKQATKNYDQLTEYSRTL